MTEDECGRTALHTATDIGYPKMVTLLLTGSTSLKDRDSWVNAQDMFGQTALHIAAREVDATLGELLLTHGAHECAQDKWDRTPLHVAVSTSGNDTSRGFSSACDVNPNINQIAFCHLQLARRLDPLLIADADGKLPWQRAWHPARNLRLLSLFFSAEYGLAARQLALGSGNAAVEVMHAALRAGDRHDLVHDLLMQRKDLGEQLPDYLVTLATSFLRTFVGSYNAQWPSSSSSAKRMQYLTMLDDAPVTMPSTIPLRLARSTSTPFVRDIPPPAAPPEVDLHDASSICDGSDGPEYINREDRYLDGAD